MDRSLRRSLVASLAWTVLGLAVTLVFLLAAGSGQATDYLSTYVLEKTLSLDNVAMFAVVLGAAALPAAQSGRALGWGLTGALALRIGFIAGGLALVDALHAALIGFAVVLVVSGLQMLRPEAEPGGGPAAANGSRWLPRAVRERPMLATVATLMVVDAAFAADSILAAFSITRHPLPIIAANVFAVLGLRPLYAVLVHAMDRFRYLRAGIGVLLIAIGGELVVEHFRPLPSWLTLAGVGICLSVSIAASHAATKGVTMRGLARRVAITVAGFALLGAGAAMLVLPGPGILVIVGGLALLAKEYAWARRPLDAGRARLARLRGPGSS